MPLTEWQLTQFFWYHMLIVFKTNTYWWSIEKNSKGIQLQRSDCESAVTDRLHSSRRISGKQLMKQDSSGISIHDLLSWLYSTGELLKSYDPALRNCKHFATAVFNFVARTEYI